ncbi:hypothetical protein, partial [Acidianus sp. RZ1]|uniref:hypothetical protein n=1 Tax=Acidianus sp. RZ1 TaxID=1540082 RepID=UPI0014915719
LTLLKGRNANVEGLSVGDVVSTVAMQLGSEGISPMRLATPLKGLVHKQVVTRIRHLKLHNK